MIELINDLGYIKKGTRFTLLGGRWYYPVKSLDIDANVCFTIEYVQANKQLFRKIK